MVVLIGECAAWVTNGPNGPNLGGVCCKCSMCWCLWACAQLRREVRREQEIREREAELLTARRAYYEERKQVLCVMAEHTDQNLRFVLHVSRCCVMV
jgi:hypothetical protein